MIASNYFFLRLQMQRWEKNLLNTVDRFLSRILFFIARRRYELYKIVRTNYNIISAGEWLIGMPSLERGACQHMNKIVSERKN